MRSPLADEALGQGRRRRELGPPAIPGDVAIEFERPSQMWSLTRRAARAEG